jgi:hypothetical protein
MLVVCTENVNAEKLMANGTSSYARSLVLNDEFAAEDMELIARAEPGDIVTIHPPKYINIELMSAESGESSGNPRDLIPIPPFSRKAEKVKLSTVATRPGGSNWADKFMRRRRHSSRFRDVPWTTSSWISPVPGRHT